MKDDKEDQRRVSRWALPGSLAAHLLVALLVIFGLPVSLLEPEEEQAINVDLVPPPKPLEKKPKAEPPPPPKKPEEKKNRQATTEGQRGRPAGDPAGSQPRLPIRREGCRSAAVPRRQ